MKKLFVIVAVLTLCATIQAQESTPFYGIVSGSGVTDAHFGTWKGGLQLGTAIPLDAGKGLVLRTLYTKATFGDAEMEMVRISPLLSWYAGKKWTFYVILGGDAPLNDNTDGAYFVGLGAGRRIFTGNTIDWLVPFTIDAFIDLTTSDVQGTTSDINQINFGFQFSKPIKK